MLVWLLCSRIIDLVRVDVIVIQSRYIARLHKSMVLRIHFVVHRTNKLFLYTRHSIVHAIPKLQVRQRHINIRSLWTRYEGADRQLIKQRSVLREKRLKIKGATRYTLCGNPVPFNELTVPVLEISEVLTANPNFLIGDITY